MAHVSVLRKLFTELVQMWYAERMINREAFYAFLKNPELFPDFDLHAQNIHDWEWLQEAVPTLIVSSAGGMLPFQAEGYLQGFPFYFRSEWGYASLSVSGDYAEKPYLREAAFFTSRIDYSQELVDWNESQWFPFHLLTLIDQLERSPFRYLLKLDETQEDAGKVIRYAKDPEFTHPGYGHSVEEAAQNILEGPYPTPLLQPFEAVNHDNRDFTPFDGANFAVNWDRVPEILRTMKEEHERNPA